MARNRKAAEPRGSAASLHFIEPYRPLRELPGPPGGADFVPGVGVGAAGCEARLVGGDPTCTEPTWVIIVSEPLDPCAGLTGEEFTACVGTGDDTGVVKDANRVIVSINGGGDSSGGGGGVNQISITAGGTVRQTITADSMTGAPSFAEARSRCGGPLTLIIDQSTSIPSTAHAKVRTAAIEFARTLRGTPVSIQVVRFSDYAGVLGKGQSVEPEPGWHEYFDMSEEADWTKIEQLLNGMSFGGSTNWEDALYRTFYNADGTTPQIVPETVVFFTDGVPTVDRLVPANRGDSGALPAEPVPYDANLWQTYTGSMSLAPGVEPPASSWITGKRAGVFYQASFARADYIAAKVRAEQAGYVRMIGVGVGGVNDPLRWIVEPGAGYVNVWEHAYGRYQQGNPGWWSNHDFEQATAFQANGDYEQATGNYQARQDYEQATTFQANLDYERYQSGSWTNITDPAIYYTNQPGSPSTYRINGTRSWYTISETAYVTYRSRSESNFRINAWSDRSPAQYYTNQPLSPNTWRINSTKRSWYSINQADFNAYRLNSPSNFQATWQDRTPAQYYTNQPSVPGLWRMNTTNRSWYNISAADYTAYSAQSPNNFSANWADRTPTQYYTSQPSAPDNWRINGTRDWYLVTQAEYDAYHGSDTSVNWKGDAVWTWVSKAVYEAGVATDPASFRDTGSKTSLPVGTPGAEYEIVAAQGSPSNHYRQVKSYPSSGPYTGIDARISEYRTGQQVLASLIAGNTIGTPYVPVADEDGSDNAEIANMFVIPGNDDAAWTQLTPVLKAIALGECGGTLTLATKTSAGAAVSAPFTYENSAVYRSDGSTVTPFVPTVVTTNAQYRTRGFDYAVPGGTFITTEIRPQASSVLLRYQPLGWECRAGARPLTAAEINEEPISLTVTNPDGTTTTVPSGWSQIAVKIAANEAVSCVLKVTQIS